MNTIVETKRFNAYTNDEMKKFNELKELADQYKEKVMEDPSNSMNNYWFHYYNDRIIVFLSEMDNKYGIRKHSENSSRQSLSDVLRQPMFLQAC